MDYSHVTGETDRMLLRPYRTSDYDAFADLHGRDDVARYLPWETRDAEASRVALGRHQDMSIEKDGDGITLAAILKPTDDEHDEHDEQGGRLVGEFVLFLRSVKHRGGEVGYVLHPDYQGRGLATEGARAMLNLGFDTMSMHRIIARIDARNVASAAVLTRLGMRKEAHLVENELFKGEWSDEEDYAILVGEWSNSSTRSVIWSNTIPPASPSERAGESPPAKA